MNTIDDILTQVEKMASNPSVLGLKKGAMGAVLFLLYYQRFTKSEQYEEITFDLLENILSKKSVNDSFDYASGVSGIARTLLFLIKEEFIDVDSRDFFDDLDKMVLSKLQSDIVINFSHDTGIIGLCRYALHRPVKMEAVHHTLYHLTKGFDKEMYGVDPVFLFPSEILQDIKLFLLEIDNLKAISEQISTLNKTIEHFEGNHPILASNCPDYVIIQQIREAGIRDDRQQIKCLLTAVVNRSTDPVLQGLSYMSLKKSSLPPWWKLF